jgi:uncharacterized protein with HEPN domain
VPPTLNDRLTHILTAIETIEDFAANLPVRLAVERALEIICEASHRLPENIKARETSIDWKRMVYFGNLLRHAYHRVDPKLVFEIASRDLPPLKAFAATAVGGK